MLVRLAAVRAIGFAAAAAIGLGVAVGGCADHGSATIPEACPPMPQQPVGQLPTSHAHSTFVPFEAEGMLLCYYPLVPTGASASASSSGLAQHVLVDDAATAQRLAADLEAAVTQSGCRNPGTDEIDAYFQGAGQSIEVQIGGLMQCPGARNGGKSAWLIADTIVPELQGLLGIQPPPSATP